MEDVFVICCMIHNILLTVDDGWESGIPFECGNPNSGIVGNNDVTVEEEETSQDEAGEMYTPELSSVNLIVSMDESIAHLDPSTSAQEAEEEICWSNFDSKVKSLVNHFSHCYKLGELKWMRTLSDGTKGFFPVGHR